MNLGISYSDDVPVIIIPFVILSFTKNKYSDCLQRQKMNKNK